MKKSEKIITEETAFSRMARICAQKECCAYDIRRKLLNMKLSERLSERIIERLINEKYIDEARFSQSFIRDKLRFNKWGRKKIETALMQKQLSKSVIEDAFSEFSDASLTDSLSDLLEKKRKSVTGKSEYEKNGKLIRFALGRGFLLKDVLTCLKSMNLNDLPDEC